MPRIAPVRSVRELDAIKDAGRYPAGGDSQGLYLQITEGGSRSWLFRYSITVDGKSKRREMGLGDCRTINLAGARRLAAEARSQVNEGKDPIYQRDHQLAAAATATTSLEIQKFRVVAERMIQNREAEWKNAKHRQQWRNTLATYAYPILGDLQTSDINVHHVKAVLDPIWLAKHETATRVRSRIENVLDYAISCGYRTLANSASSKSLKSHLPKSSKVQQRKHFPSMPYADLPEYFRELIETRKSVSARALAFTILTAKRSGEVRGLLKEELKLDLGRWDIPEERMKSGKPHREPLAPQTIALLRSLPSFEGTALIFPGNDGIMSDMTLTSCLRKMRLGVTVHGFRSTFRQWAAEQTSYPRELCELALAHTVGSKVEAAYQRSDLLEKRAELMREWANYCYSVIVNVKTDTLAPV